MFYIGKQRVGIFRQSKTTNHWNAIASDSASYKTLLYEAGIYPEQEFKTDVFNLTSQLGLMPNAKRTYLNMKSGLVSLNFNAPATLDTLHYHLAAVCQSVIQSGTSPYRKTFKMANSLNMLNVANNEGWLHTIAGDIASGDGWKLGNAILNELVITIEKDAEGIARLMKLSGTWVGTNLEKAKSLSGSWVNTTLVNNLIGDFNSSLNEFTINGVIGDYDLEFQNRIWKKFELRISNNISVPYRTYGGVAANYMFNPEVRWSLQLVNDNQTKNILDTIERVFSGTYNPDNAYLVVRNGYSDNAIGEVNIQLYNILPDANPITTENNLFMVNLSGTALVENEPLVIYLTDNINANY